MMFLKHCLYDWFSLYSVQSLFVSDLVCLILFSELAAVTLASRGKEGVLGQIVSKISTLSTAGRAAN